LRNHKYTIRTSSHNLAQLREGLTLMTFKLFLLKLHLPSTLFVLMSVCRGHDFKWHQTWQTKRKPEGASRVVW